MRTPWRFVADLVSRKPRDSAIEPTTPAVIEVKTLEYHPNPVTGNWDVAPSPSNVTTVATENQEAETTPSSEPSEVDQITQPETDLDVALPQTESMEVQEVSRAEPESTASAVTSAEDHSETIETDVPARNASGPEVSAKRPARQKVKLPAPPARTEGIAPSSDHSLAPSTPKTFFEEMAELDAEIADLRTKLAKKLFEQNTQLRKMLDRYPGTSK